MNDRHTDGRQQHTPNRKNTRDEMQVRKLYEELEPEEKVTEWHARSTVYIAREMDKVGACEGGTNDDSKSNQHKWRATKDFKTPNKIPKEKEVRIQQERKLHQQQHHPYQLQHADETGRPIKSGETTKLIINIRNQVKNIKCQESRWIPVVLITRSAEATGINDVPRLQQ